MERLIDAIRRALEELDWAPEGYIEPLYEVLVYPDRYVYVFDLAGADSGSVEVEASGGVLRVRARLEREVPLSAIYGDLVEGVVVREYRCAIRLPEDAREEGVMVTLRPGKYLVVTIRRAAGE